MNTKNRLPRTVWALGWVSFFTDFSSEMIYPLLPAFLTTVLGAGAVAIGVIEGLAESTAALLKAGSGIWADKVRRRKPFVVVGYGLAGVVRPLIGLATAWPGVLACRFLDRVGKGLRTSPRDALIADVTAPEQRGAAFGLHRAMDHAGAVVGPLVAAALLRFAGLSLRQVFLLSAIPAVVVMFVLVFGVQEAAKEPVERTTTSGNWRELGGGYWRLMAAVLVFTLGNSTDAFLLLRLKDVGVPVAWVAVLWAAHHVVKMVTTYYGGRLSDTAGRRALVLGGWIFYAAIYLAFGWVNSATGLVVVFLAYGVYYGLTEPAEKAWIADLAPAQLRGTAFGFYHAAVGLGALPASLIFGWIWKMWGAATAFSAGAALAATAALMLAGVATPRRNR